MSSPDVTTPRWSATRRQRVTIVTALCAITVLVLGLVVSRQEPTGHVVETGEEIALTDGVHSGTTHAVRLPSSVVVVRVGQPVDEVDDDAVDVPASTEDTAASDAPVRPPDGHLLLPVSWGLDSSPGITEDGPTPADEDTTPVDIGLVFDDDERDLVDERQVQSVIDDGRQSLLVPVEEGTAVSDVTVEVTYDGLTQTLSPDSGEIDSGAAAPLYEDEGTPTFDTSCAGGTCRLEADRDSTWQLAPDRGEVEPGRVSLRPHDPGLGWADEGKAWASVDVGISEPGSFYDEDDKRRGHEGLPSIRATLDGVRAEDVTRDRESLTSDVRLTFPFDADHTPKRLDLTQRHTLEGSERPRAVTVHEEIEIDDRH